MVVPNFQVELAYGKSYPSEVDDADFDFLFGPGNYAVIFDANPPSYKSVENKRRIRIDNNGFIRFISPVMTNVPPIK